jgi:hypothetical protein
MKTFVSALGAVSMLAAVAALVPVQAQARDGGAVAAGVLGGLVGGAIIGGAIASQPAPPPARVYEAEPVYEREPVYVERGPRCHFARGERYWDGYAWVHRRVRICD